MSTILIASLRLGEGRTAVACGLAGALAASGRSVRTLRVRSADGEDAGAEDDAQTLAGVPGCEGPTNAVSEQEALVHVREAESAGALCVIEAAAGLPMELAAQLSARMLLVSRSAEDLDSAVAALGDALIGVVVVRQPERLVATVRASLKERQLAWLGVLPEDRLLAGPSVREIEAALHASRLAENGADDEAVEFVMLGPISADPAQPYFLQHGSKAVVNRFDKMDLHLAALATEPDCLILTGGQQPSPYLLDRVAGSDPGVTVLLSPEGTVRTMELLDELYGRTRFSGQRKLTRAIELFQQHVTVQELLAALG